MGSLDVESKSPGLTVNENRLSPDSHESKSPKHAHRRSRSRSADRVDMMDGSLHGAYHHDGPYDATLAARNPPGKENSQLRPIDALETTNKMAIEATPPGFVEDSLKFHVPLQGTGTVPPGQRAVGGDNGMIYEEDNVAKGTNRWSGIEYSDFDIKGHGPRDEDERLSRLEASRKLGRSRGSSNVELQNLGTVSYGDAAEAHPSDTKQAGAASVSQASARDDRLSAPGESSSDGPISSLKKRLSINRKKH